MLRPSLLTAGLVALAASASAQTLKLDSSQFRAPSATKHAGIYHVATGTWTRVRGAQANLGPDIVYNNSLDSGYFGTTGATSPLTSGLTMIDEGNLPTVANNGSFQTAPDRTRYTINCFEFGYCDINGPSTSGWDFAFYDSHDPCTDPTVAPVASFSFSGMPAAGLCWVIAFDLTGGMEFCLEGDGGQLNPGWDLDDPDLDSFGFAMTYTGAGAPGSDSAGPYLRGDPDTDESGYMALNLNGPPTCGPNLMIGCPAAPTPTGGHGTFFNSNLGLCLASGTSTIAAEDATGRLTQDFWLATDNDPMTAPNPQVPGGEGCYYFGGYFNRTGCGTAASNSFSSAHLVLAAAAGECQSGPGGPFGQSYCQSLPNSTGQTSDMALIGSSTALDDDVVLLATNLPPNAFGFFITSTTQGLIMNPAGSQGILCLGTNIGRFVAPGQIKMSGPNGEITLVTGMGTGMGEWSTQAIPTSTGPYMAMTGLTSNFQLWHRDAIAGMATSNFTDGESVTWQ